MNKRILVVDDEEGVRKYLKRILEKSGYDVFTAADGGEAYIMLTVGNKSLPSADLIMLDMNMPGMSGLDFLRKIRDNNATNIPVLMISGSSDPEFKVESYKLGAYDYIEKPTHPEIMLQRVKNGLKIGEMINFNDFIKSELFMARKLQDYLFPVPSLTTEHLDILAWTKPLSDIGGDLYDYIVFRDGRVIFFIADVSGHSISAAIFTTIVHMVFRNAIKKTDVPGEILSIMNKELSGNIPFEKFVTIFCGLISPSLNILQYANAGHPQPFFLRSDGMHYLKGNNAFIGPIPDEQFTTFQRDIFPGESFLIYTDGVLDRYDAENNRLGEDFMLKILENKNLTSLQRFNCICEEIEMENITITDDCTVMMLVYR